MTDVRSYSGTPTIVQFGGTASPSPGTPLVVDTATGDLYVAITGDTIKRVAGAGSASAVSAAGTVQGDATVLTSLVNFVSTVAANAGVILSAGPSQLVYNGGANTLKVYPPSGAKINQVTTNSPIVLAINTAIQFWYVSATQWIGVLSA